MSTVEEIAGARAARQRAEDEAVIGAARLDRARRRLDATRRLGPAGADEAAEAAAEVERLIVTAGTARAELASAQLALDGALLALDLAADPVAGLGRADALTPIALLPVRIETAFDRGGGDGGSGGEPSLLVRIYPDDVAVQSHEHTLADDELALGIRFWTEVIEARTVPGLDDEQRLDRERGAWRTLAGEHGGHRAAWIVTAVRPRSLDVGSPDELEFDPPETTTSTWSRAPRSTVMPDRFAVIAYRGDEAVLQRVGNQVPDPLFLGPEPLDDEAELQSVDGELQAGPRLAWIFDVEEAIRVGMAVRLPLTEAQATTGFDRVVVVGLKLSAGVDGGADLVADLLSDHRFGPDGLSVVAQGTPTNHTDQGPSGYASTEPDTDRRFDLELGPVPWEPTGDRIERADGQVLTDALGLDPSVLQRVDGAAAADQREARAANDALWPATLGYYLRDLLEVDRSTERALAGFFRRHVSGRGPLPALRVGSQPYGFVVTSDLTRWASPGFTGPSDDPMVEPVADLTARARSFWEAELGRVTRVGGPGDPHAVLLDVLGRHATSVEHHRRRAAGPDYRSNWAEFNEQGFGDRLIRGLIAIAAANVAEELGATVTTDPPLLFELAFFNQAELLTDPVVERLDEMADERWSETVGLQRIYHLEGREEPVNYIGWLLRAPVADIKRQRFTDAVGERLPAPDALLYRWLRRAFLLANHDTTVRLLDRSDLAGDPAAAAPAERLAFGREQELVDITEQPTATRWRLMELPATAVDLEAPADRTILEHLQTDRGLGLAGSDSVRTVRSSLAVLEDLPTARLERLFREHLDVCSYRLDAWTGALVASRLEVMRSLTAGSSSTQDTRHGLLLGAYGWLEDVRPRPQAQPVPTESVPSALRPADGGPVLRRVDNAGYVHAPSLNHGASAAVLRNAYLASADREEPGRMAVDLSSARVRTALSLLEGVGEGQTLGALLGYRFERALTEHPSEAGLAQFLPAFRDAFPLVADTVTPDEDEGPTASKESRNVVDGHALVEAAVLGRPPVPYPWGVAGLPAPGTELAAALDAEVAVLADVLDSVADLLLAEAVYQSVRGNHDRAGAVLQALGSGATVQLPEIVRTPRSGRVIHHRVTLELPPAPVAWPGVMTPRAEAQPELNGWLADRLGPPDRIRFVVHHRDAGGAVTGTAMTMADLDLQPVDLVLAATDELHLAAEDQDGTRDDTTVLESRIAHVLRRELAAGLQPQPQSVTVRFADRDPSWGPEVVTVAELLPLAGACRDVVTGTRPLTAVDLRPAGDADGDLPADLNPGRVDLTELTARVDGAIASLTAANGQLVTTVTNLGVDPTASNADAVRDALVAVADHGVGDAFPHTAVGDEPAVITALVEHATTTVTTVERALAEAATRRAEVGTDPEATAADLTALVEIVRLVLGSTMPVVPRFAPANGGELAAADAQPPVPSTPVEEWWLGLVPARAPLAAVDLVRLLSETLGRPGLDLQVRQLPVRPDQPWVAGPLDPADLADGHHLHLVTIGAAGPSASVAGLVVDEWTETIPTETEITGLAVHANQPDSEPPQAILLAVPPRPTDTWSWDDLIGTVTDTLDRAKLRAVEPDHLGATALAHLLPAALTAVSTTPLATISMALVAAQEAAIAQREEPR